MRGKLVALVLLVLVLTGCESQKPLGSMKPEHQEATSAPAVEQRNNVQAEEPGPIFRKACFYVIDVKKRGDVYLLELDEVSVFEGEEAIEVAEKLGEPEPPNEFLIVNEDTSTVIGEAGNQVVVKVYESSESGLEIKKITFEEWISRYLNRNDVYAYEEVPFWIVMRDGKIITMEEQLVP